MKKKYLLFSVFALLFTACETDFDVNAQWEETTTVYGLLDVSKDIQYIKINKAFLGDRDALEIASISDSINFIPDNMTVKIHELGVSDTNWTINLRDTILEKDDGLFAADNNIVYFFDASDISFSNNKKYVITIENKQSGNLVSGKTVLITNFSFDNFNAAQFKFGFVSPNGEFTSKTLDWVMPKNGEVYQLDFHFNYLEDGDTISLVWSQPLANNQDRTTKLEGVKFFNFLSNNISDDSKVRKFLNVEIVMTVGSEDLYTYTRVNEPITGIVQQRPQFTNINNGIGLFSSRYTHLEKLESGGGLSDFTKDYILEELNRNFQ